MTFRRKMLGRCGEEAAAAYLAQKGYRILCRNYRCSLGEIDLVAVDGATLVFVEVRSRSSERFGLPEESVTWRKKRRLRQLASYFLASCGGHRGPVRFDVLALRYAADGSLKTIEHIVNAF